MKLSTDQWILISTYFITILAYLFLLFKRLFVAIMAFQFQQFLSWILGLWVVEKGWIEYPVREFQVASHTSFGFEFLIFPAITSYFVAFFPEKSRNWVKLGYYLAYTASITTTEVFIEKYTQLIKYIHWEWYWTFISIWLSLFLAHRFCLWFFKSPVPPIL